MDEIESITLYNTISNRNIPLLKEEQVDKTLVICCCIDQQWCVQHLGPPFIKEYNSNDNNCCICFDCCTWCLVFHKKKWSICKKHTTCYLCCCVVYFT